jgi:alpha/beta superfamily hydrolase
VLEEPSAAGSLRGGAARYAVVCHPHPLFGGTLSNKVVHTLARALHELDIATLRFNFRGVGASAGVHDEGRGELDDALAVVEWGRARWPGRRLWLAGFSFGAFVAARAAGSTEPERVILAAPPVARFEHFAAVPAPRCPWLIVQGDADELVPVAEVRHWVGGIGPAAKLVVLPGVDHFFHRHLHQLQSSVVEDASSDPERSDAGSGSPPR